jgi:hypothetical protein
MVDSRTTKSKKTNISPQHITPKLKIKQNEPQYIIIKSCTQPALVNPSRPSVIASLLQYVLTKKTAISLDHQDILRKINQVFARMLYSKRKTKIVMNYIRVYCSL